MGGSRVKAASSHMLHINTNSLLGHDHNIVDTNQAVDGSQLDTAPNSKDEKLGN